MRDNHLRAGDFFDAETHPKLVFKSTKVGKLADGRLEVLGDLTMRGVTKPVTLTVDLLGFGPGMDGKTRGGFHATGKLNRKDFGVSWNKTLDAGGLVLGDEVMIDLMMEGVQQ